MCCSYGTAGVLAGEFCKGRLKGMPARTPALPSLPARTVKKIIQPCLTLLNLVCWGFNLVCNLVGTLLEPCWNLVGTLLEPCWNLVGTFKIADCRMEVRLLSPALSSVEEEREFADRWFRVVS